MFLELNQNIFLDKVRFLIFLWILKKHRNYLILISSTYNLEHILLVVRVVKFFDIENTSLCTILLITPQFQPLMQEKLVVVDIWVSGTFFWSLRFILLAHFLNNNIGEVIIESNRWSFNINNSLLLYSVF